MAAATPVRAMAAVVPAREVRVPPGAVGTLMAEAADTPLAGVVDTPVVAEADTQAVVAAVTVAAAIARKRFSRLW